MVLVDNDSTTSQTVADMQAMVSARYLWAFDNTMMLELALYTSFRFSSSLSILPTQVKPAANYSANTLIESIAGQSAARRGRLVTM